MDCYHWFTHFQGYETCAVLLLLTIPNQLRGSTVMTLLYTQQLGVPHPTSNSHAPPTLTQKCFLGEHMEEATGKGARRRFFLTFLVKQKD